ncbi:MAG: biosynthetic-type acetolactate synthase large subunit [Eubacteriales bacterium]|jgi:acetolactate synthase-1/2/3 large subunit
MLLTGAEILIETLIEQGVDTIFGYPGGAVLNIYDVLYDKSKQINHILTAHEQGAAHAADGYARATGKTGVVIATSGPGATNLVTGIATAYMDSVPMIAITGNVSTELIGRDSFQEVFITGITMPITKHNFFVTEVEELADTVRKAFQIANKGRPGPVLIDIPKDVTAQKCEFTPRAKLKVECPNQFEEESVELAAKHINQSQKPLIYIGGGVISSGASSLVRELAEKSNIPVCCSMMGLGAMPFDHPNNLGMIGMHGKVAASLAAKSCDLLIAIGARFSDRVATKAGSFAPDSFCIHIDIDPAEIGKNRAVDLDIVGNTFDILSKLTPLVENTQRGAWFDTVNDWKSKFDNIPRSNDSSNNVRPWTLLEEISKRVGGNEIIVTDVGQHQMWTAQYYPFSSPRSLLTSGGLGTMGYGLGAAIGAKVAQPDKRVILFIGDGGFHMNMNELCTLVSYDLPITVFVMNNSVLGMVRQWQSYFYDNRYSCTTLNRKTDYVKLAEAFGAKGFRITSNADMTQVLDQVFSYNGPCVVDCVIDRDEKVVPMIPSGKTVDDIIIE